MGVDSIRNIPPRERGLLLTSRVQAVQNTSGTISLTFTEILVFPSAYLMLALALELGHVDEGQQGLSSTTIFSNSVTIFV